MRCFRFADFALTVALLVGAGAARAQQLTGRVIDRSPAAALPQTTVRLEGQPQGSPTDEADRLVLHSPNANLSDATYVPAD